jgi:hypothetical protein
MLSAFDPIIVVSDVAGGKVQKGKYPLSAVRGLLRP